MEQGKKSRDIINLDMKAWLGYESTVGNTYVFRVKLCRVIEIADYPLIELGAGYMMDPGEIAATIKEILLACPMLIAQNQQIPYYNGSNTWTCPEDIKFDRADSPVLVSPGNYNAFAVIPWTVPTFWQATLYYIPVGEDYTSIPINIDGYEDSEQVGVDGAVFMPLKTSYESNFMVVADRDVDGGESDAFMLWSFFYEGADLPANHIWRNYTRVWPYVTNPYVDRLESPAPIDLYHDTGGYSPYDVPYAGGYYVEVELYRDDDKPCKYYPTRTPVPPKGDPQLIHPIPTDGGILPNLMGLWLPKFSKNREAPFVFEALTVNGEPLTANGEPLEGRKY